MRSYLFITVVAVGCVGCDDRSAPMVVEPRVEESTPASQPASRPVVSVDSPTKQLPLAVIPFVADVPETWTVGSGVQGRIVLHGPISDGEVDILLSSRPALTREDFDNLVQESMADASTQPGRAAASRGESTRVLTRDNMTIIESTKHLGSPAASPEESLVIYNVRYFLPGPSLEYLVYELNVADLSQAMYDKDGELIRKIMLGLKHDPTAMGTTP